MKNYLLLNSLTLLLTLGALTACSDGSSSPADQVNNYDETPTCEVGQPYQIVGGQSLALGNILSESTVMIVSVTRSNHFKLCTGTLIDDNIVLTAAHCAARGSDERLLIVFTNSLGCWHDSDKKSYRHVTDQMVHPDYRFTDEADLAATASDIAILKFAGSIPENYKVRPLPAANYNPKKAEELVFSGYGRANDKNMKKLEGSGTLRFTKSPIRNLVDKFYLGGQFRSVAKTLAVQQPSSGVCLGDSGGPLYARNSDRSLTFIGVTSTVGNSGGNRDSIRYCHGFSLFVDVRAHLDWIQKSIDELKY
ncbi:MAG TPA: trypsin-like serine protease [Bdellovibrio sp.]|nr:trypsin-like serine protease [Bdellovibrio sp.]